MKYNIVGYKTNNVSNTCVIMTVISLTAWIVIMVLFYWRCLHITTQYDIGSKTGLQSGALEVV